MRAHWYRGEGGRNFGDALTRVLFHHLVGVDLEWAPAAEAELFGIGSIAHRIPEGYTGVVYGTGLMFGHQTAHLEAARVLALRGPLTADAAGVRCDLYADPGLLAPLLIRRRRAAHRVLGVVPHYADRQLAGEQRGHVINILAGIDTVLGEVAACREVVTSSLHALILADALGIPNRWIPSRAVLGDGFKFRDYAAAFGERIVPGRLRLADRDQVAAKQQLLLERMASLR